jgi:anti-sigma regulatory factor (Ser/Thr protein kinase)
MEKNVKLTITSEQSELDAIVNFVENLELEWRLGPKATGEINLMLEELFINTVSYGYPDGGGGTVEIGFSLSAGILTIEFSDDGRSFDPLSIKEADTAQDIELRGIGGLGMHLIRKLSDKIEYKRLNGRNILIVSKKVNRSF